MAVLLGEEPSWWRRLSRCVRAAVASGLLAGCSLTNISADECTGDVECEDAFGLGSLCTEGFCTEAPSCVTGHDCRAAFGGGACVESRCVDVAPPDPLGACVAQEPEGIIGRSLTRVVPPYTLVGAMFRLADSSDARVALGARLGVREIDNESGLNQGRGVGMVVCDNGGEDNGLTGQERVDRIHGIIDYLAGTLGVPFIVGPGTSSDALDSINYIVSQAYPTVLISPSATSPALSNEPDRLSAGDPHGLFWRTAPSDQLQGVLLATDVIGQFPEPPATVLSVAVVYLSDTYGEGLAQVFQEQWLTVAGNDAQLFPFDDVSEPDWAATAAAVDGYGPDAIVMVAIDATDTVGFIAEMAQLPGLSTLPLYLTDGSKDADILLNDALDPTVKAIIFNQVVGTAPAGPNPASSAFNLFSASYEQAFDQDPSGFAFVANAYDASYVGAGGLVWAAEGGQAYDGRGVAAGMARLTNGAVLEVNKTNWSAIKGGLTTGDQQIDIVGISGELDFDAAVGEATAPIEVWQPTNVAADCDAGGVCFKEVGRINP